MGLSDQYSIFVTCPSGLQYLLEKELKQLGAAATKAIPAGVHCSGDQSFLYRACLESRVANRVLLQLVEGSVSSTDELYEVSASVDWSSVFDVSHDFAVSYSGNAKFIRNSSFGALKVKDAVVDGFRAATGLRPNINKTEPDVWINVRLFKGKLSIYLDLSGESLHKRVYRQATGEAPLKENLAAAILLLSGWGEDLGEQENLVDPMCGSGTFLVEAAAIATKCAPGLKREKWGFDAWKNHDQALWDQLKQEALERHEQALVNFKGKILGFDQDSGVIAKAWQNIEAAGFDKIIHVEKRALSDLTISEDLAPGLLVTNPPYGERLGELEALGALYSELGQLFSIYFAGWRASVLTSQEILGRKLGWRSHKQYKLFNGALESQLLRFNLSEDNRYKEQWFSHEEILKTPARWKIFDADRAAMFRNRLKKNGRSLASWIKKTHNTCYRMYDSDIPEFALAIDRYENEDGKVHLHVQEYAPPKSVDSKMAFERLSEALCVLAEMNGCQGERIALKTRSIKKGASQYEKRSDGWKANTEDRFIVRENEARYWVDLKSYLDTGLFLDHRPLRRWIKENSAGKRFLNLFCYTGSVSVAAMQGGAAETLSIDMSNTYLNWARANLKLNGAKNEKQHRCEQADCLYWLKSGSSDELFDLIFLDPPSFSNSKRMEGVLDVQRDHVTLIQSCLKRMNEGGTLVFSNNLRRFKLDVNALSKDCDIVDWHQSSIDKDFERNPKIHQCWMLTKKSRS